MRRRTNDIEVVDNVIIVVVLVVLHSAVLIFRVRVGIVAGTARRR
jgi:hypothetical protein